MFKVILTSCVLMLAWVEHVSSAQSLGFQDLRLGMSIVSYAVKHPVGMEGGAMAPTSAGQSTCLQGSDGHHVGQLNELTHGVVRCDYVVPLDKLGSRLRVGTIFLDGRLGLIEVEPPFGAGTCFIEPPRYGSPEAQSFSAVCGRFKPLLQDLASSISGAKREDENLSQNVHGIPIRRWVTDLAVVEFEPVMCGPWDSSDKGWSKAVAEMLAGEFCGAADSVSGRQPVVLYLDKNIGQQIVEQLDR